MAAEEKPRFGARSPQWRAESQENEGSSAASSVPWDQYGELVALSRGPRFERFDEVSVAPPARSREGSVRGDADSRGRRLPREGQSSRIELRTSGGKLGYAPPAQAADASASKEKTPRSRKRGTRLVILGLVMSVLCAPALFFAIAMSGTDFSAMQASVREVSTGQSVTVDSSGGYVVQVTSGSASSCSLRGSDRAEHSMQSTLNQWTVSGLQPGDYTLNCAPDGLKMVGMTGFSESEALSRAPDALTWSSVVGMLGLSVIGLGIYLRRVR